MPGINVSALSGGDLRRLLKVAHARHDGLLADRLEWEIAARATSGGHPSAPFASPQDDDEDEPVQRMAAADADADADAESFAEPVATEPIARAPRGVMLVTLGAVAGSLLSASVFWGLGRMDMRQPVGRAEPQAAPPMAAVPPQPVAEQLVAELTAAPLMSDPQPITPAAAAAAMVETALPVATPAEVVRKPAAARTAKKHATPAKTLRVAKADGPPRPPTLSEWLKSEPEEPIF